ncbi:MAG: hypothetical protein U9N04_03290 [Patescibacteria group bacterium]|nr:hypothetical protein [Patescibacteria group bacterium]
MKKLSLTFLSKIVLAVIFVICSVVAISAILYLIADRDYQKLRKLEPADETRSWNIYKNEKYEFEIKYPDSLSSPDINDTENNNTEKVQQRIDFNINDQSKISIFVWRREVAKSDDKDYERVVINEKIVLQNKNNLLTNYVYHKSHILQIEYFGNQKEECTELYENMLSTLKLAD